MSCEKSDEIVNVEPEPNTIPTKSDAGDDSNNGNSSVELAIKISMKKRPSVVDNETGELVPYKCCSFKLIHFNSSVLE
eukprot:UN12098